MSDKCETFVARWDHAMCSTCGAAHAPTPTPAPGLDLDAVERDVAHLDGPHSLFDDRTLGRVLAVCNAAPALIAEVRALRAALTEAKRLGLEACDRATHTEQCGKTQADYHHSKGYRGCPGEDEDCTCGLAAIAAALEAL